jgi:nitrate/nitrite transport system permease protein
MPTDVLITEEALDLAPANGMLNALSSIPPSRLDALDEVHPHLRVNPVLAPTAGQKRIKRVTAMASSGLWALVGLAVVAAVWWFASTKVAELPSPGVTAKTFGRLMKDPFHNGGPNDKGIGLQFVGSLQRVFFGFGIAALIGIPFGLFIGSSKRAWKAANPVIQLLRPVSPLAWFPIWLYVLKDSPQAAKFVILITALWPILINTAAAAGSIPPDQRNVAKVFKFNMRTYVRHVLLPNAMPGIVTGMRLSMGVAWMVIVAVEMMSVGTGVGFFVWEAYNAGDLSVVMAAIIMIGLVGLTLDMFFLKLGKRFALPGTAGASS